MTAPSRPTAWMSSGRAPAGCSGSGQQSVGRCGYRFAPPSNRRCPARTPRGTGSRVDWPTPAIHRPSAAAPSNAMQSTVKRRKGCLCIGDLSSLTTYVVGCGSLVGCGSFESRALAPPPDPWPRSQHPEPCYARPAYDAAVSSGGTAPMVALGYGKFVRADRIYALVPLQREERGDGRWTSRST